MITHPVADGGAVSVTFELPATVEATTAAVCGEFNCWSSSVHPLVRAADGRLQATVELPAGRAWRFLRLGRTALGERLPPDAYVPKDFAMILLSIAPSLTRQ
jgi:hypothetical protein